MQRAVLQMLHVVWSVCLSVFLCWSNRCVVQKQDADWGLTLIGQVNHVLEDGVEILHGNEQF